MYQLISEMDLRKVERISKALSDPNRIKILQQICKKKAECLYCTEISTSSHLAQPSISHHIKQLVDADLVIAEKEGREMKYILNNAVLDEYTKFLETLKI
ncbi:MAG TPA: metalloregulator ArsR/SmtB family transcription factor [Sphingobacteriaceae bacterium]